jgi:hypothetical protein
MANEANQGQQSGGQQQKDNPSGQQQPGQKKPNPSCDGSCPSGGIRTFSELCCETTSASCA